MLRLFILSFLVSPFVEICNGYSGNIRKITRTRGTDDDSNGEDNDIDGEEPEVLDGGFSGHIPRITRTRPTVNEDDFDFNKEQSELVVTRKEADTLKFPKFGEVGKFRNTWTDARRIVVGQSGRAPKCVPWFQQIEKVKEVSYEDLCDTGALWPSQCGHWPEQQLAQ